MLCFLRKKKYNSFCHVFCSMITNTIITAKYKNTLQIPVNRELMYYSVVPERWHLNRQWNCCVRSSRTFILTRDRASTGKFCAVCTKRLSWWSWGADMMCCAACMLRCCSCHTFMGASSCCDSCKCLRNWFNSSFFSG